MKKNIVEIEKKKKKNSHLGVRDFFFGILQFLHHIFDVLIGHLDQKKDEKM